MKIIHTSMLLPVLLGGCSLPGHRPAVSDAREFVDAQISMNLPLIELAQKNLQQASATLKPVRSPPPSSRSDVTPVAIHAPGRLRDLSNIKSLGPAGPFTVVSVRQQNLQLEPMLYKVVPPGWHVILSDKIKKDFQQRITLEANDQWPYVLNGILQQHGWVALIDWPKKQVSVGYRAPASPGESSALPQPVLSKANAQSASPSTKTAATTTSMASPRNPFSQSRTVENKAAPVTPVKPATTTPSAPKVVPASKIWRIDTGSTLKDTLFNWAAAEKCTAPGVNSWTIAWLTPVNYRIDAPLQFKGDFRSALNSLFTLYGSAKVPLYAGIRSAQCVVSVDDKELH